MIVCFALLSQAQLLAPKGIKSGSATLTVTEIGYLDGATSPVQTQLSAKLNKTDTISGPTFLYTKTQTDVKIQRDPNLTGLRLLGSRYIAQSFMLTAPGSNTLTLVSGTVYYVAVELKRDTTITGVAITQGVQGNFTADAENTISLCTIGTTTFDEVATTGTGNGSIWKNTADVTTYVPFTSPYVATKGMYMVALLYHASAQTTTPTLYTGANWSAASHSISAYGLTNNNRIVGTVATQTAIATNQTKSATSGMTGHPLVILY